MPVAPAQPAASASRLDVGSLVPPYLEPGVPGKGTAGPVLRSVAGSAAGRMAAWRVRPPMTPALSTAAEGVAAGIRSSNESRWSGRASLVTLPFALYKSARDPGLRECGDRRCRDPLASCASQQESPAGADIGGVGMTVVAGVDGGSVLTLGSQLLKAMCRPAIQDCSPSSVG